MPPRFAARLLLAACACATAWAGPAVAGGFAPGGDGGTLARGFALPSLGEATVLGRGRTETRLTLDFTNEYVQEGVCAVECVTLDGETARLRFTHRVGLGAGWDFAVEVPWLDSGGGFLDGWIEDWHDWFGLPNGGRELAPQDRYLFRYERNGTVLLEETTGYSGLGDAQLTLGRRVGRRTLLRAMAKLPTGDERRLAGGAAGGALWLEHPLPLPARWTGYAALGVSATERGEALRDMQNTEVLFGGIGLLVPLSRHVRLSAQLQAHGRLYDDSELTPFARPGLPLTLALSIGSGRRGTLDLGFQEDPSVNGSPDFSAFASLTWR
jgi:hypothetical protein